MGLQDISIDMFTQAGVDPRSFKRILSRVDAKPAQSK